MSRLGDLLRTERGKYCDAVLKCMALNNQSFYSEGKVIGGNSTDRALLSFFPPQHFSYEVVSRSLFDSAKKYSSVTIKENGMTRTFIKGASEKLLPKCIRYLRHNGEEKAFLDRKKIEMEIQMLTKQGCRVLTLAMSHGENIDSLTFVGIVAIKDDLRPEAREGVSLIQGAGIQVVMITGDAKETATAIAKEVGILKDTQDIVLTSSELNSSRIVAMSFCEPRS